MPPAKHAIAVSFSLLFNVGSCYLFLFLSLSFFPLRLLPWGMRSCLSVHVMNAYLITLHSVQSSYNVKHLKRKLVCSFHSTFFVFCFVFVVVFWMYCGKKTSELTNVGSPLSFHANQCDLADRGVSIYFYCVYNCTENHSYKFCVK